jgi:hypothetical protein
MDAKNSQYYSTAKNEESVGLMPERAGFEFLEITNMPVSDKILGKDAEGRTIFEGSKGGKYYLLPNGNKSYLSVDYKVATPN